MKNNIIKLAAVAVASLALAQTIQATPITGGINFSSPGLTLDSSSVSTANEVVSWGTVSALGSINGSTVIGSANFYSPWMFAGPTPTVLPISGFWTVGIYSFQLTSYSLTYGTSTTGYPTLTFGLTGVASTTDNSLTSNVFTGTFTLQDPGQSINNVSYFSGSIAFASVPDGGTTVLLLGAALSGLAFVKRKMTA